MTEFTILTTIIFLGMLVGLGFYLRKKMILETILAFFISLSWVLFYGYNYEGTQIFLFGKINLFALVGWTLGLVIFAQVYEYFRKKFRKPNRWMAIITSGLIYWVAILILEYVGYTYLNIRLTPSYQGLFNLPLMHGTWWLKVYYLTVWLIFIGLIELTRYGVFKGEKR